MSLAIGVFLAIIAIFIINTRLQEREQIIQRLIQQGKLTEVLAARNDIQKDQIIKEDMIGFIRVPTTDIRPTALQSKESAIGKAAAMDILKEQVILSTMLRLPEGTRTLSQKTPPGKKAYTISIDRISAVGGNVRSGNKVDVIGIMQLPQTQGQTVMTLFEAAQVLETGGAGRNLESITLALTSEEIKVLTFALQNGKVKLVLRSPLDEPEGTAFRPFTYQTFMQKIYNAMGINPQQAPVREEQRSIEVYRGGSQGEK